MECKWFNQEWYRSWVVWASFAAIILLILKKAFGVDLYGVWNEISEYVLIILGAFGIINNPNTNAGYIVPNRAIPKKGNDSVDDE